MPTVATGEISTVSSGLLFSAKSEINGNSSKPTNTNESASNIPKATKSLESIPSIRAAVDGGLVSSPNTRNPKRSNKVWLYPAPTLGGELSDEQRKFVVLSEPKLQIWESIVLIALFWVSWSVRTPCIGKQVLNYHVTFENDLSQVPYKLAFISWKVNTCDLFGDSLEHSSGSKLLFKYSQKIR
jgi:hypothetical protein